MGGTGLRVATFNVRNGRAFDGLSSWPFRRRACADAVDALAADVVGLQEVYACQRRSLLRRLPRYRAVGDGRDGGDRGEACPLLWDPDVLGLEGHVTRWFAGTPDQPGSRYDTARFPRIATMARFRLGGPGTTPLQVVSTHLDAHDRALRVAAAELLAGWLDPGAHRIVLGDLNAEPGSAVLAPLLASGLRSAVPDEDPSGTAHAFTGRTDGRRIDHILVSDGVEVRAAAVVHPRPRGRLPSDHWPVVADLVVADVAGPGIARPGPEAASGR